MLAADSKAFITSVCLRNSSTWSSVDHFNAEYIALPDRDMLLKLFRVLVKYEGDGFMPLLDYTSYGALPPIKWPFEHLISRPKLKRWLFALFFRLAIPMERDTNAHMTLVIAPLNLTILFRAVRRLEEVGYPKHWLAEVLENIIADNVVTTARPPRRVAETTKDVAKEHPSVRLSTAPFAAEMATLYMEFQPLLPFRLNMESLPPLDSIRRYTIYLPSVSPVAPAATCLALVFFDEKVFYSSIRSVFDLRPALDSIWAEVDSEFAKSSMKKLRESGLAVWTTFRWDVVHNVAHIYIYEKFVEMIKTKDWVCGLGRTAEYEPISDLSERARNAIEPEARWTDLSNIWTEPSIL